jgi:hypothetical protein
MVANTDVIRGFFCSIALISQSAASKNPKKTTAIKYLLECSKHPNNPQINSTPGDAGVLQGRPFELSMTIRGFIGEQINNI